MQILNRVDIARTNICNHINKDINNSIVFGHNRKDTVEIHRHLISTDNESLKRAISTETKKKIYPFLKAAEENGNALFVFGGCVREILNGEHYNDIDFMIPGDIENFWASFLKENEGNRIKYKIRSYKSPSPDDEGKEIKVIKLQFNGRDFDINQYALSRVKDTTQAASEYSKTCDFIISSMLIQPYFDKKGEMNFRLIDPLGGYRDMQEGVLKFVEKEGNLFDGSPARLIHALRLKKKYGLKYDQLVEKRINDYVKNPTFIKKDNMYYMRIRRELKKLWKDNKFSLVETSRDIIKNKLYRVF